MCGRESRGCHGEHTCDASRVPALAADVALAQCRLRLALAAPTRFLKGASDVSGFAEKRQQRTSSQRHSSRRCTCLRREHWTKRLQRSQHCGGMLRAGTRRRGFHGAYQGHLKLRSRPGLLAWVLPYGLLFFLRLPCACHRVREGRQRGRASGERASDIDATAERGDS